MTIKILNRKMAQGDLLGQVMGKHAQRQEKKRQARQGYDARRRP